LRDIVFGQFTLAVQKTSFDVGAFPNTYPGQGFTKAVPYQHVDNMLETPQPLNCAPWRRDLACHFLYSVPFLT
jgi:hypothetical protein